MLDCLRSLVGLFGAYVRLFFRLYEIIYKLFAAYLRLFVEFLRQDIWYHLLGDLRLFADYLLLVWDYFWIIWACLRIFFGLFGIIGWLLSIFLHVSATFESLKIWWPPEEHPPPPSRLGARPADLEIHCAKPPFPGRPSHWCPRSEGAGPWFITYHQPRPEPPSSSGHSSNPLKASW